MANRYFSVIISLYEPRKCVRGPVFYVFISAGRNVTPHTASFMARMQDLIFLHLCLFSCLSHTAFADKSGPSVLASHPSRHISCRPVCMQDIIFLHFWSLPLFSSRYLCQCFSSGNVCGSPISSPCIASYLQLLFFLFCHTFLSCFLWQHFSSGNVGNSQISPLSIFHFVCVCKR